MRTILHILAESANRWQRIRDQAVVKDANNITYFGGKREQVAKNTRVKARVKAEALREFIAAKDKVIVMGHKIGDVDSFGAAIGIYRAATIMEKKVHIVINDITSSVRPLYERTVFIVRLQLWRRKYIS